MSPTQQSHCLRFLKRSEGIDFVELDDLNKLVRFNLMRWTLFCEKRIPFLS